MVINYYRNKHTGNNGIIKKKKTKYYTKYYIKCNLWTAVRNNDVFDIKDYSIIYTE